MRKRSIQSFIVIAVVGVVAAAGMSPAAAAAPTPSTTQAGVIAFTNSFKTATAKVRVPEVACDAGHDQSQAIHVIFISTGGVSADLQLTVSIECTGGVAAYSARVIEHDPTGSETRNLPVDHDNVLTLSMSYDGGSGLLKGTGRNITQKAKASVGAVATGLDFQIVNYIMDFQNGTPIATFKVVPFSNLTLSGGPAQGEFTSPTSYKLVNGSSDTLVRPTLFNPDGNFFRLIFVQDS